ncbi:MAG: MotA/TolQ/ExbB proton channel family protein [Planctomycetota bacterium]
MYFKFVCPSCDKSLKVRTEHVGKRTRCPFCKSAITITAPPEESADEPVDPLSELAAAAGDSGTPIEQPTASAPEPQAPAKTAEIPVARVSTKAKAPVEDTESDTGYDAGSSSSVSGTDVNQFISLAIGIAFGAALYGLLHLTARQSYFGELFIERGWVPYVLVVLMGWSAGILLLKWNGLRRQKDSMLFDVLPSDIAEEITVQNTRKFVRHIRELPGESQQSFLFNRVQRGLEHFRVRRNTQEVASVLASQSDIDATGVQSSYTVLKVFIWAIPILGFIGTVIGIGDSIGSFTGAMDSAQDVAKLKESLSGVTGGLATAFDTTLIALVMSLLVMFPSSSMQKSEEDLLNWVDEYCNENLLKRLKDASGVDEGEVAKQVRQSIQAAMDKHHAAFTASATMLEQTAGRGSALAENVAELQQAHLKRLEELSQAMDRQDAALQSRLHDNAQAVEQYLSSVNDGLASLNTVLAKLEGRQVVVQQQKRGWFGRSKTNGSTNGDGEA